MFNFDKFMLLQFLEALQNKDFDLAYIIAKKIVETDPSYENAINFIKFYEEMKKEGIFDVI